VAGGTSTGSVEEKYATMLGKTSSSTSIEGDMQGDIHAIDEALQHGRGAETSPAHSGTRRIGSGSTILEARVILITASGNTWGTLSFNGKEVFFASLLEPGNVASDVNDSATINLNSTPRMRRRRWALSAVCAIYLRRYRLRDTAIEVFFRRGKHRNFFVDFGHTESDEKKKNEFARALMQAAPKTAFFQWPGSSKFSLVRQQGVQTKWLNGEVRDFQSKLFSLSSSSSSSLSVSLRLSHNI